jgi:hypothetical protein
MHAKCKHRAASRDDEGDGVIAAAFSRPLRVLWRVRGVEGEGGAKDNAGEIKSGSYRLCSCCLTRQRHLLQLQQHPLHQHQPLRIRPHYNPLPYQHGLSPQEAPPARSMPVQQSATSAAAERLRNARGERTP